MKRLSGIFRIILLVNLLWLSVSAQAFEIRNNIGGGIGIPYGLFGANYELELNVADFFAIGPSVGLGTTLLAGPALQYGVRTHFLDKDGLVRFGVSYWNAVNTIIEEVDIFGDSSWESKRGNVVGVEARFQFGRNRTHGVDVHIMRILSPSKSDLKDDGYDVSNYGSPIKIGVGYVHRFRL